MGTGQGKLSVVIPAWSGTPELTDMAYRLCEKVKPMCDELLIGEDSGIYSKELEEIADRYFLHPINLGDVVNINFLMKRAKGDFICSINTDVEILEGSLRDLCIDGHVVCPDAHHGGHGGFTGGLFVIPRSVLEDPDYGYLDERGQYAWISRGEGADTRYDKKVREGGILYLSDKVKVHHITGVSYAAKRAKAEEDQRVFDRLHPKREIDPSRHKARLTEDPIYAKMWGNEEKG